MAEPARFQRRGDPANNGFSDVGNKLARRLTNCGNAVATTRGAQGVAPPGAIWSSQAFPRRSSNARNRALAFNVPCSLNSQEMLALEMLDCRRFRLGAFLTTTKGDNISVPANTHRGSGHSNGHVVDAERRGGNPSGRTSRYRHSRQTGRWLERSECLSVPISRRIRPGTP